MTYDELSVFGRLRKVEKCGPYSTFTKLVHEWGGFLSPLQVSFVYNLLEVSCVNSAFTDNYHTDSLCPHFALATNKK